MQGMILNKEGDDPYKQLVEHSPRVKMETVVRGVMMLIEDEKRNGNIQMKVTYESMLTRRYSGDPSNPAWGCDSSPRTYCRIWFVIFMREKNDDNL